MIFNSYVELPEGMCPYVSYVSGLSKGISQNRECPLEMMVFIGTYGRTDLFFFNGLPSGNDCHSLRT